MSDHRRPVNLRFHLGRLRFWLRLDLFIGTGKESDFAVALKEAAARRRSEGFERVLSREQSDAFERFRREGSA